jgi:hypothetical protein
MAAFPSGKLEDELNEDEAILLLRRNKERFVSHRRGKINI